MSDSAPSAAGTSVLEEKRQVTIGRIRKAARDLLLGHGLDVTMDEIAEAAGVSRRTLFRHFENRDSLLAGALAEGIEQYGEMLPSLAGPPAEGDWERWLRALCEAAHRVQASYGPGYWQLLHRPDLPPKLADVEHDRRRTRTRSMARIAGILWNQSGGDGPVPRSVVGAVTAHLSARFTVAVTDEANQTWQDAADLAFDAVVAALRSARSRAATP